MIILTALLLAWPVKLLSIDYTLRVDSADLSGYTVEMRIHNAPATFTIAAAAHPEYDDKYWRYIENLRVSNGEATRADSVLWRVKTTSRGDVVITYRLQLPPSPAPRAAWRAFLTPSGGLVGGPHSFLYVVGEERAPARVHLQLPRGWSATSGMDSLKAPNMHVLMDSPILVGRYAERRFDIRGVPHYVAYLGMPGGAQFDTTAFVGAIERFSKQVVGFWGSMPYRKYVFMFEDSAFGGGLEHINSFTLGGPSGELARNPQSSMREIGHEFFHTWNLMLVKPIEYRDVDYRTQPPVSALWFSEGLTIYYSDMFTRRAGVALEDTTPKLHLERLIARYFFSPGNARISAEQASRAAYNSTPDALGDYDASTHLQGELIGMVLDLLIRDATGGARSMDDVMRLMQQRFSKRGFTSSDVERAVTDVCKCNVKQVFDQYVRNGNPIDFDRYLGLMGWRATVTWEPAIGRDGQPAADNRVTGWERNGELRARVWIPDGAWARAGIHSGDRIVSLNGTPVTTWPQMRAIVGRARIGDTLRVVIARPTGNVETTVNVTGYNRPVVRIEELPAASERQRELRAGWLSVRNVQP
jgi:predicted metalloprotease with PDZ domain